MANTENFDVVYSCVNFPLYFLGFYQVTPQNYGFDDRAEERVKKLIEQIKAGKKILILSTRIDAPKTQLDKLVKKVLSNIGNVEEFNNTNMQLYHDLHRQFIKDHLYYKFVQNKKRLVEMIYNACDNYVTEDTELYYCDYILDTLMKSEE